MDVTIKSLGTEHISLTNEIPDGFTSYHIPGSEIVSAVATFGAFLVQIIEMDGFSWLYSIYNIAKDSCFEISLPAAMPVCKIALEGTIDCEIKTIGHLQLKKGQFNFIHSRPLIKKLKFARPNRYVLVDLFYPTDYMLYALKYYPGLQEFSNKIELTQPAVLSSTVLSADAEMMEMLHRLVHMPYSINIQRFHIDLLKELLFKTLKLGAQTVTSNLKFSMQQVEAIEAAKEFIDTHLPSHFSIVQIARRVGLNEQILKTGFKEIYGTGLYTYLQQQVLTIAKKQLEETNKSAKEIAFEAGYKNANNFSAAFKKKFGKTPLEWRKRFR
jgi:AraC-like DNA-binding protein